MLYELKSCKDIYDLSDLLDIPAKVLTYILYVIPETEKYTEICLSKKGGGTRQIFAPSDRLKALQSRLSFVLYECQYEVASKHGRRSSFGFERGRSILDNADVHRRKRWVFNIDLEDFFPSINFGRVISFFKKNKDFSLNPKVATYIAQIACFQGMLPQGAPSSPVIANLICGSLDFRLASFAGQNRCNYTRYADDITFSTNLAEFPSPIAIPDTTKHGWTAAPELEKIVTRSGFAVNQKKTRMSYRRNRQMVTGLVVNEFPNIERSYYRRVRASIDHLIKGKPVEIPRFCRPFRLNCENEDVSVDIVEALSGQISFCAYVSDRSDQRSSKEKFFNPTAIFRSYADLIFFKYFCRGGKTLVITEGESDILYLKSALLKMNHSIDGLVEHVPNEKNRILVDFFKFPVSAEKTIGLAGGTGNINLFLRRFRNFLDRANPTIFNRRVIILLDNDEGYDDTSKIIKSSYKINFGTLDNSSYANLSDTLSIVKTPHGPSGPKTCIEDFLDPSALNVNLDGKTFSSDPKYDINKHFGKYILSNHIYSNFEKYDFSNFDPIIGRLKAAIDQI